MANNNTQNVRVTTTIYNDYRALVKCQLDAASALKRLQAKGINVDAKLREIIKLHDWAESEWKKSVI